MITVQDQNNSFYSFHTLKNLVSLLGHEFVPSTTPLLAGLSRLKIFFFSLLCHICETYLLLIIFGSTSLEWYVWSRDRSCFFWMYFCL